MRQPTDIDENANITTHNQLKRRKLKILAIKKNGLNN